MATVSRKQEREREIVEIYYTDASTFGWTDFYRNINCWAIKSRVNGL